MNLFDVCAFIGAPLGTGPRQANDSEVAAYAHFLRERRGLVNFAKVELHFSDRRDGRRYERGPCVGATFGGYSQNGNRREYENGSYSIPFPGHDAHKQRVTFEALDESGEVERSQTLPREPKKGGVIWSREEVRKACGPVLKVAKPRKAKAAPIAEPAAAPPIEAPEIPASAGAGESIEAPGAPMGQIDADALREAPSASTELVQEFQTAPNMPKTATEAQESGEFKLADLSARLAALESRVATISGESITAPTVARRTPAHERAIRRAWAERKAARLQRSIAADQMRMREQVQSELRTAERHRAEHQASWQAALLEGAAINRKRRRAVILARDLQKRLNAEYALVDRANMKRSEAEEAARDWSRKEEAQRQRANVAEVALTKLRADLADPHQPERESDLLLLKRQRDDARAEAERERNAAAAVNERNARLQSVMADLGERFEVMAGRVARAEAALRVQGAVA